MSSISNNLFLCNYVPNVLNIYEYECANAYFIFNTQGLIILQCPF